MDTNLLGIACEARGVDLIQRLRVEQQQALPRSVVQNIDRISRFGAQHEIRDENFQKEINAFIARKADVLFVPATENVPEVLVGDELHDNYAIMPPLEYFMGIPENTLVEHFFTSVEKYDIVIAVATSIIESGLILTLLCTDDSKARHINEFKIPAFCPLKEIPRLIPTESPLETFKIKDIFRGTVLSVNQESKRVILSLMDRALPPGKHAKLGLISEDELPVHYRRKMQIHGLTFEELLHSILGFNNTGNVPFLQRVLGTPKNASVMHGLQEYAIPEREYADNLRKQQSQKLAHQSVVQGVMLFKQGNQWEAMHHLNRALQVDATNVEALVARGALYANNESYPKAVSDFKAALLENPTHGNARKYLYETLLAHGKVLEDDHDYTGAEECYQHAIVINPQGPVAKEALRTLEFFKKHGLPRKQRDANLTRGSDAGRPRSRSRSGSRTRMRQKQRSFSRSVSRSRSCSRSRSRSGSRVRMRPRPRAFSRSLSRSRSWSKSPRQGRSRRSYSRSSSRSRSYSRSPKRRKRSKNKDKKRGRRRKKGSRRSRSSSSGSSSRGRVRSKNSSSPRAPRPKRKASQSPQKEERCLPFRKDDPRSHLSESQKRSQPGKMEEEEDLYGEAQKQSELFRGKRFGERYGEDEESFVGSTTSSFIRDAAYSHKRNPCGWTDAERDSNQDALKVFQVGLEPSSGVSLFGGRELQRPDGTFRIPGLSDSPSPSHQEAEEDKLKAAKPEASQRLQDRPPEKDHSALCAARSTDLGEGKEKGRGDARRPDREMHHPPAADSASRRGYNPEASAQERDREQDMLYSGSPPELSRSLERGADRREKFPQKESKWSPVITSQGDSFLQARDAIPAGGKVELHRAASLPPGEKFLKEERDRGDFVRRPSAERSRTVKQEAPEPAGKEHSMFQRPEQDEAWLASSRARKKWAQERGEGEDSWLRAQRWSREAEEGQWMASSPHGERQRPSRGREKARGRSEKKSRASSTSSSNSSSSSRSRSSQRRSKERSASEHPGKDDKRKHEPADQMDRHRPKNSEDKKEKELFPVGGWQPKSPEIWSRKAKNPVYEDLAAKSKWDNYSPSKTDELSPDRKKSLWRKVPEVTAAEHSESAERKLPEAIEKKPPLAASSKQRIFVPFADEENAPEEEVPRVVPAKTEKTAREYQQSLGTERLIIKVDTLSGKQDRTLLLSSDGKTAQPPSTKPIRPFRKSDEDSEEEKPDKSPAAHVDRPREKKEPPKEWEERKRSRDKAGDDHERREHHDYDRERPRRRSDVSDWREQDYPHHSDRGRYFRGGRGFFPRGRGRGRGRGYFNKFEPNYYDRYPRRHYSSDWNEEEDSDRFRHHDKHSWNRYDDESGRDYGEDRRDRRRWSRDDERRDRHERDRDSRDDRYDKDRYDKDRYESRSKYNKDRRDDRREKDARGKKRSRSKSRSRSSSSSSRSSDRSSSREKFSNRGRSSHRGFRTVKSWNPRGGKSSQASYLQAINPKDMGKEAQVSPMKAAMAAAAAAEAAIAAAASMMSQSARSSVSSTQVPVSSEAPSSLPSGKSVASAAAAAAAAAAASTLTAKVAAAGSFLPRNLALKLQTPGTGSKTGQEQLESDGQPSSATPKESLKELENFLSTLKEKKKQQSSDGDSEK